MPALDDMLRVSDDDLQRDLGRYQDIAMSRPVAVTRDGRDRLVILSSEEYHRLKRRDREVLGLDDFTDADIAAIEQARPPAEAVLFDHELNA